MILIIKRKKIDHKWQFYPDKSNTFCWPTFFSFFKKDRLSGIIDYYFSCYDFYAFEIAICLNALCFEGANENLSFNVTKAKKFMDGYSSIRKLKDEEKES